MNNKFMPEPHGAFSKENPFQQIIWDATSIDLFMRDPLQYYYVMIEGWQSLPAPPLLFGTIYHEACGTYIFHRLNGDTHNKSVDAAFFYAMQAAVVGVEDPKEPGKFYSLETIVSIAPNKKDHNHRDMYRLLRAVVWWCEKYGMDEMYTSIKLPNGKPAVEYHFCIPLDIIVNGENISICGHLDNICRTQNNEMLVRDWKHTASTLGGHNKSASYYFLQFRPNVQINHYSLAAHLLFERVFNAPADVRGVLIEAMQTTVTASIFERDWIQRSRASLEEWLKVIEFRARLAGMLANESLQLAQAGRDPVAPWAAAMNVANMRKYGHNLFADAAFRLPNLRRQFLSQRCVRGPRWDPTKPRELKGWPDDARS